MLASNIIEYELETIEYHRSRGMISDGTFEGLQTLDFSPPSSGYYYSSRPRKNMLVLHYTAGFLGGDISTLTTQDYHVSVPFVVGRSGAIIKLFDPDHWSYHLGRGAIGGNKAGSKRSVAIEISNIGYLEKSGNWLWNYKGSRYCKSSETEYFAQIQKFREKKYFATYTTAQIKSVKRLVNAICEKYGINNTLLPIADRFEAFGSPEIASSYSGIASHVNFRRSGKWDIGPAFDWNSL